MKRALAFVGGCIVGFLLGANIGSQFYVVALTGSIATVYLMVGNLLAGVAAGFLAGWKVSNRQQGVQLQGRFWRFPQGNLMVQISLRRMGSVVGGGEE